MSNQHLTRRAALALAAASLASPAFAAGYPSGPVTIIVPFAAGGAGDVYARLLVPQLVAALGQPVIVDDRPGAGSIIGTEYAKNATPDGTTLLLVSSAHTVNETLFAKKPYKLLTDFVAVAPINSSELVLVTRADLGVKTVPELIAMAKAKPGTLSYASSGPGTPYHMAGELFKQMAGVDILHVPYKGSSPARIDVIAGQVDMMFDATTTMTGFIKAGKVLPLATTGPTRSIIMPNLPTVAETLPGYESPIWLGIMAPKGTPADVVAKLNATISAIASKPEVQAAWAKDGVVPVVMDPAQFTAFLTADVIRWAKVIQVSGAKPGQ